MIIELGHFALILALVVAATQMVVPAWGARVRDERLMAYAEPAAVSQLVLLLIAFLALMHAYVTSRFLRRERRRELAFDEAAALPDLGRVGKPRRLDAALGADPRALRRGGGGVRRQPAGDAQGQRARGAGVDRGRVLPLHPADVEPVRAPRSGAVRRARASIRFCRIPRSSFHPPFLYMRLRRLLDGVLVRHRRADRRAHGRGLGALGAAVDARCLDVPHHRHRHGLVVGLLRARLGRLVVLGSGRERVLHAVARRHGAAAFGARHGEARGAAASGRSCSRSSPSRSR